MLIYYQLIVFTEYLIFHVHSKGALRLSGAPPIFYNALLPENRQKFLAHPLRANHLKLVRDWNNKGNFKDYF